jgi:catechol 2,3-dioxygenase-like lactoylglutathione lyase family enzyme
MPFRFTLAILLGVHVFTCFSFSANSQEVKSFEIPLGGNAYQTAGKTEEEIKAEGILTWEYPDSEFSVYFKADLELEAVLSLGILPQSSAAEISVTLNGRSQTIALSSDDSGSIAVGVFNLVAGYNELQLKGLKKEGTGFAQIKSLYLQTERDLALDYVKDNIGNRFYWGRRGPSVHLSYTIQDSQDFKWFYNELTVPEGEDPIGSYFMANGFGEGYFGIQVNSETERRVLFSVWSPFSTDNPNEIPEGQKIKLLRKGDGVYTGEFGNEGSGGQSYLRYDWVAGNTYKFLNSVEPDGKGNTVYTAYFFAPEHGEWMLIASFLRPKTDTWYKRPHSFLENFVPESGNVERLVFFENQWAADEEGNWVELTEAKFTGDDIARRGYRKDFAGGADSGKFYLKNGGFFDAAVPLQSIHLRPSKVDRPNINFEELK